MVAEYLLKKGHKNIGYIQFTRETSEEMEKKIGFYSKLRQSGFITLKKNLQTMIMILDMKQVREC